MAAEKNTIVTTHADGSQTTEVVDWTEEQLAGFAEVEANAWRDARVAAYPSTGDQFDMHYWDSVNGTTTWEDAITAVKEAHPKPE
jgi:hypothetical protein